MLSIENQIESVPGSSPDARLVSNTRQSVYLIFTIARGRVNEGVLVESLKVKNAGVEIPAVLVGEEGRGRKRGVLPVALLPKDNEIWNEKKQVTVYAASLGSTKTGNPKLFAAEKATTISSILTVLRTPIGYRGGNAHTGDCAGWKCRKYGCDAGSNVVSACPDSCPQCGASGSWDGPHLLYANFPGSVIVSGHIAQGDAGRMGGGEQFASLVPAGKVFRTGYSGRLYGGPSAHYYLWNGERLLSATWEERAAADLF